MRKNFGIVTKNYKRGILSLGLSALMISPVAFAQAQMAVQDEQPHIVLNEQGDASAENASEGYIEFVAVDALVAMAEAMRMKGHISLNADLTTEIVLDSGQKLQFAGKMAILASRPNMLKVTLSSERQLREYYYDGENFTVVAPRVGFYATVDAPASIYDLVLIAKNRYNIDLPLADLFMWSADPSLAKRVHSAFIIRPEMVAGKMCMHYAFRQDDRDWQIWIDEESGANLPCKIVITDRTDPSLPQFSATINWHDGDQAVSPNAYHYKAGDDDKQIIIAEVTGIEE